MFVMFIHGAAQDEDPHKSLWDLGHTREGILGLILSTLSFLSMVPFVYIEIASYHDFGTAWFNFQNGLDVATYVLQVRACFRPPPPPTHSFSHPLPPLKLSELL
jgi:hypothetical protein